MSKKAQNQLKNRITQTKGMLEFLLSTQLHDEEDVEMLKAALYELKETISTGIREAVVS